MLGILLTAVSAIECLYSDETVTAHPWHRRQKNIIMIPN